MTQVISPASEVTLVSETLVWPFLAPILSEEFDPKSPALRYQTERVKRILAQDKPLTPGQADQIQLYWNQALPIFPFKADADPADVPTAPFWLFVDPKADEIDVIHNELGFNLWLRELYIDGKFFLSPKLKRHKLITNTFVVNLFPIVASSYDENYEKIKGTIIPYTLLEQLPVGLTLDDPLTHKIIYGNDDELTPIVAPAP